jgi:hypothetical protein
MGVSRYKYFRFATCMATFKFTLSNRITVSELDLCDLNLNKLKQNEFDSNVSFFVFNLKFK